MKIMSTNIEDNKEEQPKKERAHGSMKKDKFKNTINALHAYTFCKFEFLNSKKLQKEDEEKKQQLKFRPLFPNIQKEAEVYKRSSSQRRKTETKQTI